VSEIGKEVGRSLVVVEATRRDCFADYRPNATIVTQLFAAKLDLPQSRARRRASAEDAAYAYGATRTILRVARRGHGPSWAA
jgi:hypothetical protein